MSISKSYEISVHSLDFNILEVQTYSRLNEGNKEVEWKEVSTEELLGLEDMGVILEKNFEIKQMYEVEIFSKSEKNPYSDFNLAIGANTTKCKVYLSIKEGSKVKYNSKFEQEFTILINKAKIRANILINVFDSIQNSVVSKITDFIRVKENVIYEKNETFLIAESYEPTQTVNDALILHYDKKDDVDEQGRVDYANRGFIQSVHKDELLIEYIKPQNGKPGRDCRGKYLEPSEPVVKNFPSFDIDDTIKIIENDTSIEYRAVENGYISLDGNLYTIKSEVDVGQISFRTTGSISTGLDSDVSMVVKETDAVKDAIGSGMSVEVSEIEIEGNVGSNAKVNALKATIGGLTHKTSYIKAENLNINVHKGQAYGKNIHITRLEHGKVDGNVVDITQAIGGDIKAKEITIELCSSNVKATASKLIEIKRLQGSENTFTIDPMLKKDVKKSVDTNKKEISNLTLAIKDIKKEIEKYTKILEDNSVAYNDIKKRLLHYKKSGVKMPASFVKQYQQFTKIKNHLTSIKEELEIKKDKLDDLTSKTSDFQDDIFDARIINRDRWVGYNEIIFKLVDPPLELIYKPKDGSRDKVFALVKDDDDQYEIKVVKE
ncbi:MAG: DUF342 domain-containing protein [Epsilonproteobacteria bacterium]|nr:DUF342 domain-containing protein [Campylobacterota bacterium]